MKVLLISNMYPSKDWPAYGVFVQKFEIGLKSFNVNFVKSVIKGRKLGVRKAAAYLLFFIKTLYLLYKKNYDIIYVHYALHSLVPLLFFINYTNKPVVVNVHGDDLLPQSTLGKLLQFITRRLVNKANVVVTPSKHYALISQEFYSNKNVFVSASGGVNLTVFSNPNASQKKKSNPLRVGYVSRIDKGKGWETLLEAVKSRRNEDICCYFAGHGTQVDALKKKIVDEKLSDRVFYLGKKNHKELAAIYPTFDILVFPSLEESLGLVGIEAMACGTPVIGSDIGGIREYLIDKKNGLLFNPYSASDLNIKIDEILSLSDVEYVHMSKFAINSVSQFSSENVAENMYSMLSSLVIDGAS